MLIACTRTDCATTCARRLVLGHRFTRPGSVSPVVPRHWPGLRRGPAWWPERSPSHRSGRAASSSGSVIGIMVYEVHPYFQVEAQTVMNHTYASRAACCARSRTLAAARSQSHDGQGDADPPQHHGLAIARAYARSAALPAARLTCSGVPPSRITNHATAPAARSAASWAASRRSASGSEVEIFPTLLVHASPTVPSRRHSPSALPIFRPGGTAAAPSSASEANHHLSPSTRVG
jgi:hypothetical protein